MSISASQIVRKGHAGQPGNKGQFAALVRSEPSVGLTGSSLPLPEGWVEHDPQPQCDEIAVIESPNGDAEFRFSRDPETGTYIVHLSSLDEWDEDTDANPVYLGRLASNPADIQSAVAAHGQLTFDSARDYAGFTRAGKEQNFTVAEQCAARIHESKCREAFDALSGGTVVTPSQLSTIEYLNAELDQKPMPVNRGDGKTDLDYVSENGQALRLTITSDGFLNDISEGTTLAALATPNDDHPLWERFGCLSA